jgi:hypothetical protein
VSNIGLTKKLKGGNAKGIGSIKKLVNGKRLNNMINLDEPVSVKLSLLNGYNPLTIELFEGKCLRVEDITKAINEKRFYKYDTFYCNYEKYIEWVADLVVNPNDEPISMDFGVIDMTTTFWPIDNKDSLKLAAASYRGDESILVNFSGSLLFIAAFLQVSVEDFE